MTTCKHFLRCCNDEFIWWNQFNKIAPSCGLSAANSRRNCELSYFDICRRLKAVVDKTVDNDFSSTNQCAVCTSAWCKSAACLQDSEECIIFDFGTKTTWFKYVNENNGQLSMHPTVAPSGNPNSVISAEDDFALNRFCPVCMKIWRKRNGLAICQKTTEGVEITKSCARGRAHTSRFSLRSLHCLDGNWREDEGGRGQDYDKYSAEPVLNQGLYTDLQTSTEQGAKLKADCIDVEPFPRCGVSLCRERDTRLETYRFLIRHMLKRNAFLQTRGVPLVICEPWNSDGETLRKICEFAIEELKVPGICFIPKSIAISLYLGLDTCLVVDSGANNTVVTPVINEIVQRDCVQHRPIGGHHLTRVLLECIAAKECRYEIDESSIDSSKVKRECHVTYHAHVENQMKVKKTTVHIRGRNLITDLIEPLQVELGHELFLAANDMYINLNLPEMISNAVSSFPDSLKRRLLGNIALTGGNSRVGGLSLRLGRDLQVAIPEHAQTIRVCDTRVMTGRMDVVIGASYAKKWQFAKWVTRRDYVMKGWEVGLDVGQG